MFKEAFVTIFIFIIITLILALFLHKKRHLFQYVTIILLLICCITNTIYNFQTLFPDFVLDDDVPLGDCRENLFLYKSDSEFPCEMLFPILQDRTVLIDDSFTFYDKFFGTFSKNTESIHITNEERAAVIAESKHFSFNSKIPLIEMMDYAFPENDFYDLWYGPEIFFETDNLSNEDTLVAVIDEYFFLYLVTESYYREILNSISVTKGEESPYVLTSKQTY